MMDIQRTQSGLELRFPVERLRAAGLTVLGIGILAAMGGGAGVVVGGELGTVRTVAVLAAILGAVLAPVGLFMTVSAPAMSRRRAVTFDRVAQTVVGGGGARTVLFRAISHVAVTRAAQTHTLELVLRDGSTWKLHAESTMNPTGCEGIEVAANEIVAATGLARR